MNLFGLPADCREQARRHILQAGTPSLSFGLLMILSTLIATFGLIANSTATVIGAMIVAPLMGPIQALALAMVEADMRALRRAMLTELLGIVLCVVTSGAVVWVLGSAHIDFGAGEIRARIHPTLYDLGVGLFAGMAGAYATVRPELTGSIAGVAIAVALVPPLSVCGLCLAAGLKRAALGSFMLFLANFLSIELANALMFGVAGLGDAHHSPRTRAWWTAILVKGTLLLLTGAFLSTQLQQVLVQRQRERFAAEYLRAELAGVPGSSIERLEIRGEGERLSVQLLLRAPQEPSQLEISRWQAALAKAFGREVVLSVGTLISTYYSSTGQLFGPPAATVDPELARLSAWRDMISESLRQFESVEMTAFRQLNDSEASPEFLITVQSPTEFGADRVRQLQTSALQLARQRGMTVANCRLIVRVILSRDYNQSGLIPRVQPGETATPVVPAVEGPMPTPLLQPPEATPVSLEPQPSPHRTTSRGHAPRTRTAAPRTHRP